MAVLQPFDVWVRHTWCNQEVAGEHYYAKTWRPFFPRKLPMAGVELSERALLIREPANRHDRNAVRIEICGQHVGHLPAEDATRYRAILDHLVAQGFAARAHARLRACPEIEYQYDRRGDMREVDTGRVNCRITLALPEPHLMIPLNPPPPEPHAMLPMGGSVMVKTDGVLMSVFEPVLTDAGEGWVHATLHEVREQLPRSVREVVEVRINGRRAGQLTPAMSKKFLPVIRTLAEQGRVCATPAIVRGNRLNAEVRVFGAQAADLPQAWLLEHANHALVAAPRPAMTGSPPDRMEPATSKAAAAARVAQPDRSVSRSVAQPNTRRATPSAAISDQPPSAEPGWFPDPGASLRCGTGTAPVGRAGSGCGELCPGLWTTSRATAESR